MSTIRKFCSLVPLISYGCSDASDAIVAPDLSLRPVPASVWHLDRIDQAALPLDGQYNPAGDGSGVTVYVVDTGIDDTHPEFGGRVRLGFAADGGSPADCHGHGTNVAGLIGSNSYGVAPGAELVSVRVLGCVGNQTVQNTQMYIDGVNWVLNDVSGPAVVNVSVGGGVEACLSCDLAAIDSVFQLLVDQGIPVVAGAGNGPSDVCSLRTPARLPDAITVGASSIDDAIATRSNYGACIDIFAPGENVLTTKMGGGSVTFGVTSASTPVVSGAIAVALQTGTQITTVPVVQHAWPNTTHDLLQVPALPPPPPPPPPPPSAYADSVWEDVAFRTADSAYFLTSWADSFPTDTMRVCARRLDGSGAGCTENPAGGIWFSGASDQPVLRPFLRGTTDLAYNINLTSRAQPENPSDYVLDVINVPGTVAPPPPNSPPTAAFSYVGALLQVTFTDLSTDSDGSVVAWSWDFGDGSPLSTLQNPVYTYAASGTYNVTLNATDDLGDSAQTAQNVTIDLPPTADFSSAVADLDVQFTDLSTDDGSLTAWSWDFGDGNASALQSPAHSYAAAGTYDVTLTVTDDATVPQLSAPLTRQVTVTDPPILTVIARTTGPWNRADLAWIDVLWPQVHIFRAQGAIFALIDVVPGAADGTGSYNDRIRDSAGPESYEYAICDGNNYSTSHCTPPIQVNFP